MNPVAPCWKQRQRVGKMRRLIGCGVVVAQSGRIRVDVRFRMTGGPDHQDRGGGPAKKRGARRGFPAGTAAGRRAAHEQVDEIFRQWRSERPDIDPTPVRIYGLIGQIHLQSTAFINEVLAPLGLVRGTFDVLSALRRVGVPYSLTPKQLARHLLLSGAGLTSRLNQLEALHLIARLPEPSDRRTVRVQLTAAGEALVNQAIPLVFEAQWRRIIPLGADSLGSLVDELTRFAEAISSVSERGDAVEAEQASTRSFDME
jgi:DNA-binding MarR family transcriptional regulator